MPKTPPITPVVIAVPANPGDVTITKPAILSPAMVNAAIGRIQSLKTLIVSSEATIALIVKWTAPVFL